MNAETRRCIQDYFMRMSMDQVRERDRDARDPDDLMRLFIASLQDVSKQNAPELQHVRHEFSMRLSHLPKIVSILETATIFSFMRGEKMYPHTHGDSIFLPRPAIAVHLKSSSMISVLLHECIHIYQRRFPIETHKLIVDIWKHRVIGYDESQRGTNPDINNVIYSRASLDDDDEHPFEKMAYRLTDILLDEPVASEEETKWIQRHFV